MMKLAFFARLLLLLICASAMSISVAPTTSQMQQELAGQNTVVSNSTATPNIKSKPLLQKMMIVIVIVAFILITLLIFCACRCLRQGVKREDRRAGLLTNPDTLSEHQFRKLRRQSEMLFRRDKRKQARQQLQGLVQVPLVEEFTEARRGSRASWLGARRGSVSGSVAGSYGLAQVAPPYDTGNTLNQRRYSVVTCPVNSSYEARDDAAFGSVSQLSHRRSSRGLFKEMSQRAATFGKLLSRNHKSIPAMDGETYNNTITVHRSLELWARRASLPASGNLLSANGTCERIIRRPYRSPRTVQTQTGVSEEVCLPNDDNPEDEADSNQPLLVKGKTMTFAVSTPVEPNAALLASNAFVVSVRSAATQTELDSPVLCRRRSFPTQLGADTLSPSVMHTIVEVTNRPVSSSPPFTSHENQLKGNSQDDIVMASSCDTESGSQVAAAATADNNSVKSSDTGIGHSVDDRASPDNE